MSWLVEKGARASSSCAREHTLAYVTSHVSFYVGEDQGHLVLLGGNQAANSSVCLSNYRPNRLLGYRWPPGFAVPRWNDEHAAPRPHATPDGYDRTSPVYVTWRKERGHWVIDTIGFPLA